MIISHECELGTFLEGVPFDEKHSFNGNDGFIYTAEKENKVTVKDVVSWKETAWDFGESLFHWNPTALPGKGVIFRGMDKTVTCIDGRCVEIDWRITDMPNVYAIGRFLDTEHIIFVTLYGNVQLLRNREEELTRDEFLFLLKLQTRYRFDSFLVRKEFRPHRGFFEHSELCLFMFLQMVRKKQVVQVKKIKPFSILQRLPVELVISVLHITLAEKHIFLSDSLIDRMNNVIEFQ